MSAIFPERDRTRTLNGKFDARCVQCGRAVYCLWVDDRPPPSGCAEGHDDDVSRCGSVYNALVMIVVTEDHLKKALRPDQEFILKRLGPKADALLAHIRAGKAPPGHRPREIDWSKADREHARPQ